MWNRVEALRDDPEVESDGKKWVLVDTHKLVGTRDELDFFRVINENGKNFFASPEEYLSFAGVDPNDGEESSNLADVIEAWHKRHKQTCARSI